MSQLFETNTKLKSTDSSRNLLTYSVSLNSLQKIVSPAYSTASMSYFPNQDNESLSPFLPSKVYQEKNKNANLYCLNDGIYNDNLKFKENSAKNRFLEIENLTSRSCDVSKNLGVLKLLDEIEKKEINMSNESLTEFNHVSTITLCKVCGGDASGFHYGVDSCEGCKGFYRRCLTQGINNVCNNNEKCLITALSRNNCQFCRFKKCREVGMSKEGSRLGRRPKRLKIAEANMLMKTNKYEQASHHNLISQTNYRIPSIREINPTHLSQFIVRTLTKKKKVPTATLR